MSRDWLLGAALGALVLAGCASNPGQLRQRTESPQALLTDSLSDLPGEQDLQRLGLTYAWDFQLRNEEVTGLYLFPEALLVCTRSNRIVMLDPVHGFPKPGGVIQLDGPLSFEPTIYRYPEIQTGDEGAAEALRPSEFMLVSGHTLYLVDASGNLIWRARLSFTPATAPAGSLHRIFIPSLDNRLHSVGKDTRVSEWNFLALGPIVARPIVDDEAKTVYVVSEDGNVYGFATANLQQVGVFPTSGAIRVAPTYYFLRLYFASEDMKLYSLEALASVPEWSLPMGGKLLSSPLAVDKLVFAPIERELRQADGSYRTERALLAIERVRNRDANRAPGALRWQRPDCTQIISIGRDYVYAADNDRRLHAIELTTGNELWISDFTTVADQLVTNPSSYSKKSEEDMASLIYMGFANGSIIAVKERHVD